MKPIGLGEKLDPSRRNAAQIGVDHDAGLGLQLLGDCEDRTERAALARQPVVGSADPMAYLNGMRNQQQVIRTGLGLQYYLSRLILRPAIGVHDH